jgi:hypothetical protein
MRIINIKPKTKELQNVLIAKQETTKTKGVFGFFSKEKNSYSVVLEKEIKDYNEDSVTNELVALVKENMSLEGYKKIGMSVAIIKRKNKIRIGLVSIISI